MTIVVSKNASTYDLLDAEVLLFDKEGIMRRTEEKQLLQQQMQAMEEQIKNLQGDLQTARRESVSDRKRIEVEKFKSRLSGVESDKKAKNLFKYSIVYLFLLYLILVVDSFFLIGSL